MKQVMIILMLWLFTGCSSTQPPLKIYTLKVDGVPSVISKRYHAAILKVAYTGSVKERFSDMMRFSYSPVEQGEYQNSQWSNDVGMLLQGVLVETLSRSGLFKAVLSYNSSVEEDYRLESTLFSFSHAIRGPYSYALVSIQFDLIDTHSGRLVKSRRFSYREDTKTTDASGYVEATNKIMTRLSYDLIHWL